MGITYGKKDKVFRQYGKPSLLLDFARRKKLLDTVSKKNPITFTRASSVATYVDADGLIKKAAVNLALYSEQFDNAYWVKVGSTISANQIVSPDGKQTADKIVESAGAGGHRIQISTNVTSGTTYTISAYMKAGERVWARFALGSGFTSTNTWFDLSSGTVGTVQADNASIENIGNGWYRLSITQTATSTTASGTFFITMETSGSGTSYTGDGTSGIYIWGAQIEETDPATMAPTEYIKTTSTISGAPRFDHEPTTGNVTTNLIKYSEMFDNSLWQQAAGANTITANSQTAPNDEQTADLMSFTSSDYAGRLQLVSGISGTTYTFSVYIKRISGSGAGRIQMNGANVIAAVTTFTATTSWQRIQVTATATGTGNFNVYIYPEYLAGRTGSYALWGAQLEISSTAGTYVRTLDKSRSISDARAESKGLLVEEARTNLLLYSESGTSSTNSWTNVSSGMTITYQSGGPAPDGSNNSLTIQESGSTGQHYVALDTYSVTSGSNYTVSFWAKNISGSDTDSIKFTTGANFPYAVRTFYIRGSQAGTASGEGTDVKSYGNGWYRFSYTATANATNTNAAGYIDFRGLGSGNAYNNVVSIFGVQVEAGSFPTSYIPTNGSTVQRTADITTISGNDFKRTNLLYPSNIAPWGMLNVYADPISNCTTTAPDGSNDSRKITQRVNSASRLDKIFTLSSGVTYSFSYYTKKISGTLSESLSPLGLAGLVGATVTQAFTANPVGNGWYRQTSKISTSSTSVTLRIYWVDQLTSADSYAIWGAQLEQSEYPTDYIPTTATSASFFPFVDTTQGTMLSVYSKFAPNEQANRNVWSLDSNGSNYVAVFSDYLWHPYLHNDIVISTGGNGYVVANKPAVGTEVKNSLSYTPLTSSLAVNGSTYQINNSALPPMIRLTIGARAENVSPLNGHIKKMTYWNSALSGSALQLMTGDE